jgi:hypothetical protein
VRDRFCGLVVTIHVAAAAVTDATTAAAAVRLTSITAALSLVFAAGCFLIELWLDFRIAPG